MGDSVNIKVKPIVKFVIWCLVFMSMLILTNAGSCREGKISQRSLMLARKPQINLRRVGRLKNIRGTRRFYIFQLCTVSLCNLQTISPPDRRHELQLVDLCLVLLFLFHFCTNVQNPASLCCNGRDSSCVVQKTPVNVIEENPNVKPCYCDGNYCFF